MRDTKSDRPEKTERPNAKVRCCRQIAAFVVLLTFVGCSSNRFQLANRGERYPGEREFANAGAPIVPPVPQPAAVPAEVAVTTPGPDPLAAGNVPQPVVPPPVAAISDQDPNTGTVGPIAQNTAPIVDQEFRDLLPTNPNMAETGARNRRLVTEIPRPGPPGTSLNLAHSGPELVGRVLDAYGRPVVYASVQVRDISRSQVVAEVASTTQGLFRVRNLVPGVQYELSATAADQGKRLSGATVAVPPDTAVIIQLHADEATNVSRLQQRNYVPPPIASTASPGTDPIVRLGFGQTYVSTPALLPHGMPAPSPSRLDVPPQSTPTAVAQVTPIRPVEPATPVLAETSAREVVAQPATLPRPSDFRQPPIQNVAQLKPAFASTPLARMEILTTNGQHRSLGDLSGELILLDFFGSWCGPCRQCVPKLNALHREFSPQGLQIVGIACEYGSESEAILAAERVRRELGIEYAVLVSPLEEDSELRQHFRVSRYPSLVLLDRSGTVLFEGSGGDAATFQRLRNAILQSLSY